MAVGYLKSIEAVLAVILVVFMLVQIRPTYDVVSKWDDVNLQQTGENALLSLAYTGELRSFVYTQNYSALNSSLYKIIPDYVAFNIYRGSQIVVNNGDSNKTTTVVYFISGNNSYNPATLHMKLWYKGD